jgi:hypothetical protein
VVVVRGLDEQYIHAAFHQILRLPVVRVRERLEGDVRKRRIAARWQHPRGPDGAGDEARPFGGRVLVAGGSREASRVDVQLARPVLEPPLAQAVRRALERARLDDVAPDVGPGEDQVVVAALERLAAEVLGGRIVELNIGAHRAVVDEHAIGERAQVGRGRVGSLIGHSDLLDEKKSPDAIAGARALAGD